MDIIGYGSGSDGRDYLPTCPYCGMEMVEDDHGIWCNNPDCEVGEQNLSRVEREGKDV